MRPEDTVAKHFRLTKDQLAALRRLGVVASNQLEARAQAGAARIKLAGSVISSKERITRTGSRMAWVRMSDAVGTFEVTFFSETLGKCRDLLVAGDDGTEHTVINGGVRAL